MPAYDRKPAKAPNLLRGPSRHIESPQERIAVGPMLLHFEVLSLHSPSFLTSVSLKHLPATLV